MPNEKTTENITSNMVLTDMFSGKEKKKFGDRKRSELGGENVHDSRFFRMVKLSYANITMDT